MTILHAHNIERQNTMHEYRILDMLLGYICLERGNQVQNDRTQFNNKGRYAKVQKSVSRIRLWEQDIDRLRCEGVYPLSSILNRFLGPSGP